jgi:chaperone required for assembly of F1-ATPase
MNHYCKISNGRIRVLRLSSQLKMRAVKAAFMPSIQNNHVLTECGGQRPKIESRTYVKVDIQKLRHIVRSNYPISYPVIAQEPWPLSSQAADGCCIFLDASATPLGAIANHRFGH